MTGTITISAEHGRKIAEDVAKAIRHACGELADRNGDQTDLIDDTCDAAIDAAMQALADAFLPAARRVRVDGGRAVTSTPEPRP